MRPDALTCMRLAVLCLCASFSWVAIAPFRGVAAAPEASEQAATITPDTATAKLLQKVERQVADGHATSPEDDSASRTWGEMLELQRGQPLSPSARRALAIFVVRLLSRAEAEQRAGKAEISSDLTAFAKLGLQYMERAAPPVADENADSWPQSAAAPIVTEDTDSPATTTAHAELEARRVAPQEPEGIASSPVQEEQPRESPAPEPLPRRQPDAPPAAIASTILGPPAVPPATVTTPPSVVASLGKQVEQPPPPITAVVPNITPHLAQNPSLAAILAKRGDAMLAIKDISAARKLYERAADAGSALGASALAKTYDPAALAELGVIGIKPDSALAKLWYRRAANMGDRDAEVRLRTLLTEAKP